MKNNFNPAFKKKNKTKETLRVYFDTETYQQDIPGEELPMIIPYFIGCRTDEPNSYRDFLGTDACERFLEYLFSIAKGKKCLLYAFNIDYDFKCIQPTILSRYPDMRIKYTMTGDKTFISGSLYSKKDKITITFKDLWQWDKSQSLSSYYNIINSWAKEDPVWAENVKESGIIELEKLKIDYTKKNLRKNAHGDLIYEDDCNKTKTLDIKAEEKYLYNDVVGLPLIRKAIIHFKDMCIDTLNIDRKPWEDRITSVLTLPSFAKVLLCIHLGEEVDDLFRPEIDHEDYESQDSCYFGGFVAGNRLLTKVEDSYDEQGKPNIISYDINSMYPWAMALKGLPFGLPLLNKPKCEYCTWYSVIFEKELEPGVLYRAKPEYDFFNNTFFGKHHFPTQRAGFVATLQEYVLKEVYDVFVATHDSHIKIVNVRYQALHPGIRDFIDKLYMIKGDKEKYTKPVRDSIKLIMNSLYGKLAERYHTYKWIWNHDAKAYEKVKNEDAGIRKSILAGLYITSVSKSKLWTEIKNEVDNGNQVVYCDTDSIKLIVNNPIKLETHSTKLGYWKEEGAFTHFYHPNKCKKYFAYNATKPIDWEDNPSVASAGIPYNRVSSLSIKDLVTLYDENNDIEFKKCKTASQLNKWFQVVIRDIDVRFNPSNKEHPTHIIEREGNKLIPC